MGLNTRAENAPDSVGFSPQITERRSDGNKVVMFGNGKESLYVLFFWSSCFLTYTK